MLPASWIKSGNTAPVVAVAPGQRGRYWPPWKGKPGQIRLGAGLSPGTTLHEYVHHVQVTPAEFDALFANLHRRRTKGAPLYPLQAYMPEELAGLTSTSSATRGAKFPAPTAGRLRF